jgi:hypothetical protein
MFQQNYNQQSINDRIDNQIAQLQQMKEQMRNQSGGITQNFQLTPTQNGIKYANTYDDVAKETVFVETPFFSKDLSVMWLKNTNGNIKSYELKEIVPKDEKDIMIQSLQMQINDMKGMLENAKSNSSNDDESNESEESSNVSISRTSTKKSK